MKHHFYIFLSLFILSSCKQGYKYESIYDSQIYQPITYNTECTDPFDFEAFVVDTILANRKEPIFRTCKEDSILNSLFSTNKYSVPFYRGTLNNGKAPHVMVFSFDYQPNAFPINTKGYLWIKRNIGHGVTIFKAFENKVDGDLSLKSYYKSGYVLLVEKSDPNYDIIIEGKTKKILLRYCILRLHNNGDIQILNTMDGSEILNSKFKDVQTDLQLKPD